MTRVALALSPHLDDAAFSCGGLLHLLARQGWRVVVATLFTRSMPDPQGFALACQLDKGLAPDVDYMALRRGEDAAAMAALGVEPPIHAALPEAPHRGYHSARALFDPPLDADPIAPDLGSEVAALIDAHRPALILAPQAVGGHVDHVQLVRVLSDVSGPVLWWRDFPYLARSATPPEPFKPRFRAMAGHLVSLDSQAQAAKEAACLAYASQIGFQFGGADGLHAKLAEGGAVERFCGNLPAGMLDGIVG